MEVGKLIEPPPLDPVQNAIENCELMIEEGIETLRKIDNGESYTRSYQGEDYDAGFAQGRKDACRVVLLSLRGREHITSEDT